MSDLKPCPFCGGKASVKVLEYDDDCKVWGVFCELDLESEYSHGHFVDNYPTEAEAIAAWNNRADEVWPITEITTDHIDLEHGRVKQRFIPERTCTMSTDKSKVGNDELESLVCSQCGHEAFKQYTFGDEGEFIAYPAPNYCPNCGAKVVGE